MQILTLRDVELHVEDHFDGIQREHPDDENRHGERHAERRQAGAQRLALEIAENHLYHRRRKSPRQGPVESRQAMTRGWLRPHRFGRRQADGARNRRNGTQHTRTEADGRARRR